MGLEEIARMAMHGMAGFGFVTLVCAMLELRALRRRVHEVEPRLVALEGLTLQMWKERENREEAAPALPAGRNAPDREG